MFQARATKNRMLAPTNPTGRPSPAYAFRRLGDSVRAASAQCCPTQCASLLPTCVAACRRLWALHAGKSATCSRRADHQVHVRIRDQRRSAAGLGAPAEPFRRQLPLAGHKSGWFQKDGAQRRRRELALAAPSRGKSMVAYSALRNRLVHYETGDLMSARRLRRGDRWNLNSGKSA